MTLVIRARTKIERIGNARTATVTEGDCPQAGDNYRFPLNILQQASEPACRVECHDRTAAEIPDQQPICMLAERARRKSDSPGRINEWEPAASIQTCGETMEYASLWI